MPQWNYPWTAHRITRRQCQAKHLFLILRKKPQILLSHSQAMRRWEYMLSVFWLLHPWGYVLPVWTSIGFEPWENIYSSWRRYMVNAQPESRWELVRQCLFPRGQHRGFCRALVLLTVWAPYAGMQPFPSPCLVNENSLNYDIVKIGVWGNVHEKVWTGLWLELVGTGSLNSESEVSSGKNLGFIHRYWICNV